MEVPAFFVYTCTNITLPVKTRLDQRTEFCCFITKSSRSIIVDLTHAVYGTYSNTVVSILSKLGQMIKHIFCIKQQLAAKTKETQFHHWATKKWVSVQSPVLVRVTVGVCFRKWDSYHYLKQRKSTTCLKKLIVSDKTKCKLCWMNVAHYNFNILLPGTCLQHGWLLVLGNYQLKWTFGYTVLIDCNLKVNTHTVGRVYQHYMCIYMYMYFDFQWSYSLCRILCQVMSSEGKYIVWVVCDLVRGKITTIPLSVS